MPRVHYIKKALKDNSAVKKGEPYYWWKFRYGGKRKSATRPRPSQLTQSKYSEVLAAQEAIEDAADYDMLKEAIESASQVCNDTAEEYSEAAESFASQGSNQERADHLWELASGLESVDFEDDIECPYCDAEGCKKCKDGVIAVDKLEQYELGELLDNKRNEATELDWDSPC